MREWPAEPRANAPALTESRTVLHLLRRIFGGKQNSDVRLVPESHYVVSFDDESIVCRRPNGTEESVRWSELGAVIVETNDTGPWGTDVMWLLVARDGESGCVVPQGATGEEDLLKRLQQLPNFDNEALIAAMSSVENKQFLCWKASA